MADTIKVQVMQKLAEVLEAIPELGSVHRWQGSPTDLDRVKLPAVFFWDEDETRDKRNRLAIGTLKLYVAVFIRLSPAGAVSFNDQADNLQGAIHNALIGTAGLKVASTEQYRSSESSIARRTLASSRSPLR